MSLLPGIFFFILLCQQSKSELFPQGKQWKYSYYGLVRTGSLLPSEAYSQWDLRALLTITSTDGIVVAQLSNFNSSLFNGPRDGIPEYLNPTPIPQEASALGDPFVINYVGTQVDSISVKDDDPLWSVNIKRAIASILQLNFKKLNTPASYITENNLYGSCNGIEYSVVNNTEFIYVRKVIDPLKCYDYPAHIWSSSPSFNCPGAEENPFTASTIREYTLARGEGKYELKHAMSNKRLYVQPFQAQGEAQQTYQYQLYQLLETSSAPEPIELPTKLMKTSLVYVQNISDLTHGRYVRTKQQSVLGAISTLLDEVVTNLDEENLDQNIIQFHRELMFLYYNMFLLNTESFNILYADISIGTSYQQETRRNIFLELLPQVGSEDSVNFMKDLIVRREIKDLITIKLLAMFPFYVKQHSRKLLNDMEVLLTLSDNYEQKIRHTAILSFATLVYQTYQAGKCDLETLEDYALRYFNSFAESTNYEKRMVYLQGLDNLQLGSIAEYLASVVQNNEQSRHIRFLAALASMQTAPQRPLQIYQVYWPILTDRTQHLEMRVVAFTMLLIAQPTRSRLLTLFWYMQADNDPHLQNYFYTTLVSLHKTQYPCFKHLSKLAEHVVRFLRPPRTKQQWMTGNYILDYGDNERAFGGILQLFLIGNPISNNPNVIYLNVNNYATARNLNQMAIYLKVQGVADHLQDMSNEVFDIKNFDKIIKLLEESNVKLIPPEEIHIELIVKIQQKTVFTYFIDGKGFKKFGNEMKHIKMLLEYHVNYQSIVVPYTREYMEPSDLGTLVIRAIVSNSIASTRGNFLTHTNNHKYNYNFDTDFRYYTYTTSFLEIYNPISDMWHGIERGKKLQTRFLFNGTLNIDIANSLIELTEVRNHNEYINILIHSQSYTYLVSNGTKGPLQHHCPKCDNIYNITAGPKKEKFYLVNKPFENFGNKFQVVIFDCDSYKEVKNTLLDVYSVHQSNSQVLPIAKPFLYLMHLSDFISYIPCHGSCGISVNIKPLYKESTQLKTTLLLPQQATVSSTDPMEKGVKLRSVLTLSQQKLTDGTILQFWNATLISLWKPAKRYLNFSLTVEHEDSNHDENKLCLNSEIQFPDIQADMFSIKPSKPTTANFNAIWGRNDKDPNLCPTNGASIQAMASASITDQQKQITLSSENWPYKECRNTSLGHKFTPISLACYLASKEAATYRKYSSDIKFNNMPEWFVSTAQKLQSLIGLIQKNPAQNEKLEKNLKIGLEFSATEPKVSLKWNSKEAVIHYDEFEYIGKLLLNTRFLIKDDWNINLGLNKVCLITSKYITTVDNRTILTDDIKMRHRNTLATADCSQFPKFAIFLEDPTNFENMAYTVYAGNDILRVRPMQNNITITLNDKVLREELDIHRNINVWQLEDDVILTKTKVNNLGIDIYYTKEYMVITIPGFYTGKICGLCSTIKNHIP